MKTKSEKSISSLLIDDQIIASANEISNYFNNVFTSVAVEINKNIVKSKKKNTYPTVAMKTVTLFSFSNSNRGYWRPNKFNENK